MDLSSHSPAQVYLYHQQDRPGAAAVAPQPVPPLEPPRLLPDLWAKSKPRNQTFLRANHAQTRGVRFFQQSFEHADHHYHLRSFPAQPDETFVSVFEDELNPYFYANKLPTLPDRPNSSYLKPNPNSFKLSISETIVAHKKKEKTLLAAPSKAQWQIWQSLFEPRLRNTDAKQMWDTPEVKNKAFDRDWKNCLASKGDRFLNLFGKDCKFTDEKVINVREALRYYC